MDIGDLYYVIVEIEEWVGYGFLYIIAPLVALVVGKPYLEKVFKGWRNKWRGALLEHRREQERIKELVRKAESLENTKEQESAQKELSDMARINLVEIRASLALTVVWLAVFSLILAVADVGLDRVHEDIRESYEKFLSDWDSRLDFLLRFKIKERPELNIDFDRLRKGSRKDLTEKKKETIRRTNEQEEQMRASMVEARQLADRWYCQIKVNEYMINKRYAGYGEDAVVMGISRNFQLCMLERGWQIYPCLDEDKSAEECIKLPYLELPCVGELREWLEKSREQRLAVPCNQGATIWNWKKHQEVLHGRLRLFE
ncbi:MAG: hypothetical protein OXN23_01970 [Gammaproteobacteria bacterium]|nr:hypothetical protein [Gammaproteobacteria bacterium]